MMSFTHGSTMKHINRGEFLATKIPLPPLEEQKRLAAILDHADELRRARRKVLSGLDELAQSLFSELFGDPIRNEKEWPSHNFSEVALFENGDRSSNYPSGDDLKSEGVLFLSTKNIVENRLDLRNAAFITPEKFKSLSRGKAQRMDLIITLRGTLGSCCIFDCSYETAFINAQMMLVRPRKNMTSRFLHALLTSKPAQDQFARIGHGAAVPQLTAAQLSKLSIPLPPIELQQQFAEQIEELEAIKSRARASLTELDALFASLQARAFAGELSGAA
jgi:type I restriction enzyme S subunit